MNPSIEELFISSKQDAQRALIARIFENSPMFDVEIRRLKDRRLEDQHGHWLADFATQDYLGFDFHPDVLAAAAEGIHNYGSVVAWCRLVATVDVFNEAERRIAELIGTESASIFASTTLLNHGVIPALLGKDGVLFLDKSAHMTMYEGAKIARDSGARLRSFPTGDYDALEQLLIEHQDIPKKLIAVDGVYSMTGDYPDLPRLDALAKKHKSLLFVDDAHGFGVVGENPSKQHPYGHKGNGIVRHFGLDYDNILYVGCFSKAYGTFGAFIGCSFRMRDFLLSQATPHDLGGAGPASAMTALAAGLEINHEHGDALRGRIWDLTQRAIDGLRTLGYRVDNQTGFPIISVWLGQSDIIVEASQILYENHILLTLAPYPMVRRGNEAFRITVTATNTEAEVDQLIQAFEVLKPFLIRHGVSFTERSTV